MSLLMQALKKAERAKQSHAHDEELAKPSEAFDQMLALAPQAPDPQPTLELAALAPEAAADEGVNSAADAAAQVPEAEPVSMLGDVGKVRPADAPRGPRNVPPPPQMSRPVVRRPTLSMPEPRTIRLLTLAAVVLLIAAVFGYIYWRAVYGPGSSRNLPMIPMPGQDIAPPAAPPGAGLAYPAPALSSGAPAPYPADATPAASAYPPATPPATQAAPAQQAVVPQAAVPQATAPSGTQAAAPRGNAPAARAPAPIPNAEEETRRIAQENLERAERMERILEVGDPNRRRGPPPAPYVPPAEYLAAHSRATPGGSTAAAPLAAVPAASQAAPQAAYPAASSPSAYAGAPDSAGIRVARSSTPEQINPALLSGYTAFNNGDFASARQQYQAVLRQDANNRDALLGMAALALHERQAEQAAALYSRLLDINPNDNDALAGLAGLRAGDPAQTEGQLRRVLAKAPESPSLLFALGNLYARQGRWQEAQQQYFKAYTNAPDNADYAFNLAVGLDRLGQGKLALGYYQRALSLKPGGAVNFDRNAAAGRIRALGGQ